MPLSVIDRDERKSDFSLGGFMGMEWLPATANALSAPVTKLIEVVASGCGRFYEPTGTRRQARANADAALVSADTEIAIDELQRRAQQRWAAVEQRRQENIESVIRAAADALPENVSDEPVSPDWSARFFADCQDICDDEMRTVWGKVLAGEIRQPSSYSTRTLGILKNLQKSEAEAFARVSLHRLLLGSERGPAFLFIPREAEAGFWKSKNVIYADFDKLNEAGLITINDGGEYASSPARQFLFVGSNLCVELSAIAGSGQTNLGHIKLTTAGSELARVCEWQSDDHVLYLNERRFAGFNSRIVQIEGRDQ